MPDGIIGFVHAIFLWQSLVSVAVELVVVTLVMYWMAPSGAAARDAAAMGIDLGPDPSLEVEAKRALTPGERLEHSRVPTALMALRGGAYLVQALRGGVTALTLNNINLAALLLGMVLHGTPARLMRAVREATPATWACCSSSPSTPASPG